MDPASVMNPAAYYITPIIVPTNSYHYSTAIVAPGPSLSHPRTFALVEDGCLNQSSDSADAGME
jgi:hypothetical protein